MIVVSNTSPLTNLAAIGQFHLLEVLYGHIWIPEAVWEELNAGDMQWPGSYQTSLASWITRRAVSNHALVKTLQRDLDQGEAEAIALAVEIGADLLLVDEKEGRRAAQRLGLHISGVLGLLVEAKAQAKLNQIRPLLDRLRGDAGFYMTDNLYVLALNLSGESIDVE